MLPSKNAGYFDCDSVRTVTGITVIIRLSSDERQIDDGDLCPFNDSPWGARTRNDFDFYLRKLK